MLNAPLITSIMLLGFIHFAAMLSPGPTAALVLGRGLNTQTRSMVPLIAGITFATFTNVMLALFGLAAFIAASGPLNLIITIAGALYLAYLGCKNLKIALEKNREPATCPQPVAEYPNKSVCSLFRDGYLVNLLNPKIAIFYMSIFSQIIPVDLPKHMMGIFGLQLVAQSLIFWSLFAWLTRIGLLKDLVRQSGARVHLLFGIILILFSMRILWTYV